MVGIPFHFKIEFTPQPLPKFVTDIQNVLSGSLIGHCVYANELDLHHEFVDRHQQRNTDDI